MTAQKKGNLISFQINVILAYYILLVNYYIWYIIAINGYNI